MGLAPSGYRENMGDLGRCEVPVPIFSQPLRVPRAWPWAGLAPTTGKSGAIRRFFLTVKLAPGRILLGIGVSDDPDA